ncbi:MAG: hypothetical protein SV775_13710, partial [Thermodesulfobacteriota bacterium]|nr:hypothetical protein [Thermodesulfobacteriota bacterium]
AGYARDICAERHLDLPYSKSYIHSFCSWRCTWHIRQPLNTKEIANCLSLIQGSHDFSAFRSSGSGNTNPIRSVLSAKLQGPQDGLLRLIIEADGFLRHMVRNIVGTLKDAGLGKMGADTFKKILESRDRQSAGPKAPPQGLFLMQVRY